MQRELPVDSVLPEIALAFEKGRNVILIAEPGSGKTTRVPVSLLDSAWLQGKKIVLLEPRRLAARAAATFIASERGEAVGATIGYRTRGDSRAGGETRLEVITEGLLTRRIQSDPALEDVGLVVFDEFHERSLQADLALALVLDSQKLIRPDLRILVMSATIDGEAVSSLLGNSEIVRCPGREYPVEVRYGTAPVATSLTERVVDTVCKALSNEEGDILVFLPGRAEIQRCSEKLGELLDVKEIHLFPLHSEVRGEDQQRILAPQQGDRRRVILSTNVAETSVTIPRVRVVVDSGLMRVPRFNPRRGMSG
ncbi:MAG: DEAD/DEAH box helicase, partial [Bdellovibrionales bacterium]|nr:DEAD/DEAH box helicase [Bdellovibrionales bacterium]